MKFYKLIDEWNFGEVVKEDDDGACHIYVYGAEKWIRSSIMVAYQWPDDPLFEQYDIITESKAMQLLEENRKRLHELLKLARAFAEKAHAGQADKGGQPYILHPIAVADQLESLEDKIVALLHDVLEDTPTTARQLLDMGFPKRIVRSLEILTKTADVDYDDYLRDVKRDSVARRVKMADLRHNLDLGRIPDPSEMDLARIEKYKRALAFLEN